MQIEEIYIVDGSKIKRDIQHTCLDISNYTQSISGASYLTDELMAVVSTILLQLTNSRIDESEIDLLAMEAVEYMNVEEDEEYGQLSNLIASVVTRLVKVAFKQSVLQNVDRLEYLHERDGGLVFKVGSSHD